MKVIAIDKPIGFWDADGPWFRAQLEEAGGEDIRIELASPGGMVSHGIEMYNMLKKYPGNSTSALMGVVGSMATYFALAADTVEAEDNSVFFVHNPSRFAGGDHRFMQKVSANLKSFTELLARGYVEKTGKSETEIRAIMNEETYFFGKEIMTAGFADKIIVSGKTEKKEDAVAFAQLAVEEVFAKMQVDENSKNDLERAVALLKIEPVKAEWPKKTVTIPATGREKIINTEDAMDIAKILAEHPALYKEIKQVGVTEGIESEHKRVVAHITVAEPMKAYGEMIKFIKSKASVQDDTVHAEYMAAGLKNQSITARLEDEPDDVIIDKDKGEEAHVKAFNDTLDNELGGIN